MSDYLVVNELKKLNKTLRKILKENKHMSAQMDQLVEAVTVENQVIDSAVVLINGFAAQLQTIIDQLNTALAADQVDKTELAAVNAAAQALHNEVEEKTEALAAAVAAGTPAE
jgi:hypothetical protein